MREVLVLVKGESKDSQRVSKSAKFFGESGFQWRVRFDGFNDIVRLDIAAFNI